MTPSRFRWFVVFLLFAIMVVNYIDRAAIAAVTALPRFAGDPPPGWKTSDADGIRALGAFFHFPLASPCLNSLKMLEV